MEFNAAWGNTLYRENARLSPRSSACNCASTNQSGLSSIADLPHQRYPDVEVLHVTQKSCNAYVACDTLRFKFIPLDGSCHTVSAYIFQLKCKRDVSRCGVA